MFRPQNISGLHKDYIVSNLRSQAATLHTMLYTLENAEHLEEGYVDESLREMERKIRALRRMNQGA